VIHAQEQFVRVFALPTGYFDELVEQPAPGPPACHPRLPAVRLFGVFFDAFFTHGHD